MPNSLKLFFLIFKLLPSLTSSVNNFSQSLSETELKIGQNASQIVERDGAITLVGGTLVVEIIPGKGEPQQKECTLSFPVVREQDGKKGFLISCDSIENYFVDGTKIGSEAWPTHYFPSKGISYAFLDIYPEFWSDENSPNVLYNDCDNKGCKTVPIPLLPTPNQDQLLLKTTVCAYGGASGYVCGEIVDFDATITTYDTQFHPVTKVSMNKPCLEGDMGAPVYIPINVPNSKQIVASAVGQVIRDKKDSETNMWYYVPLTRTFENVNLHNKGGLKLAVSEKKEPISVYGGMKVLGFTPSGGELCQRPCTLSFPIFYNNKKKGYLTSFICAGSSVFVTDIQVGHSLGSYNYKPEQGLDYVFINVHSEYFSDTISTKISRSHSVRTGRGIVDVDDEPLPIFSTPLSKPLSVGDTVYASGGSAGTVNGKILATGVTITVTKPGSCGKETEQFHDVVKVKMNKNYYWGDLGAPVYIPIQLPNSKQIVASPVGQVVEDYNQDTNSDIWYYTPLDRIFKDDSSLKLNSGGLEGSKEDALCGGTMVQGHLPQGYFEPRSSRPCTLSFPVKTLDGSEGFLASHACSTDEFLVQDANGNSIVVGSIHSGKFSPERGLDYRVMIPDDKYWSKTDSKSVLFHLNEYEYPQLPKQMLDIRLPLTAFTRPPLPGFNVCVFGGVNKKMTCGAILQFGVSINIPKPKTKGRESVRFYHAVKVEMIDDYDKGYMGAPVYIPARIPFDTKIIAAPVGQIVETTAQYKEFQKDSKIWYYTPISLILEDSGAELLLGDFSNGGDEGNE